MVVLFDESGAKIGLGSKLGTGGEGDVFDVTPLNGSSKSFPLVAKIYHSHISLEKQAKLQCMVSGNNEQLRKLAAWPIAKISKKESGPICGFLMPKAIHSSAIHHFYSPAQRKREYPELNWGFLVNVARNVAAAFATVHRHGHVIGDVNPNLVFVSRDSTVKLIDCDSFQISGGGKQYPCEVGVPHFTPPELQGKSNFSNVIRTVNHDNFGLAVLIFHLLLMGRHPFAGVYSGAGDLPLEKLIAEFRYAYGKNSKQKLIQPPPNSVLPSILPNEICNHFEAAFSEVGVKHMGRPSASQWVSVLDNLKTHIRTCGHDSAHKFSSSLYSCPWCAKERDNGIYYFISLIPKNSKVSFNLAIIWPRIEAVAPPDTVNSIVSGQFSVSPRELPAELQRQKITDGFKKAFAVIIVVGSFFSGIPLVIFFAVIFGVALFLSNDDTSYERNQRQRTLNSVREEFTRVDAIWKHEAGDGQFKEKISELVRAKTSYEKLPSQFDHDKNILKQNLRKDQLKSFLSKKFISNNHIPHIGPARQSTLASFGIETAADVSWNAVINIKGFGRSYTSSLIDWRESIERQFKFDPTKGIDPDDLNKLNKKYSQKQAHLRKVLLSGPEQLMAIKQNALTKRRALLPTMESIAKKLAQAEVDMTIV